MLLLNPLYLVVFGNFYFFLLFYFCVIEALFPTMQTLCDFGMVKGKHCFEIFEEEKKKERNFSKKEKRCSIFVRDFGKLYYLDWL